MKNLKKYNIGIDIGINNVGWSILNNETEKIEHYGVRLFNPSDSAADRRVSRNDRRRRKRKNTRVNDLLNLMKGINFPNQTTIDSKLIEKRYLGINEKIDKQDIVNIFIFLVSHRGYIPYGDEQPNIIDLKGELPCEYFYRLFKETGKYRALNENVSNKDNQREIRKIFEVQRKYYPELTKEIENQVIGIFIRKRQYWEGPGGTKSFTPYGRFKNLADVEDYEARKKADSHYEKYLYEELIGHCEIFPKEKTAPKLNYYAELFNLLNDFTNISFKNIDDTNQHDCFVLVPKTKDYKLNSLGLQKVIDYCYDFDKNALRYETLFKKLFNLKIENITGYRINKDMKPEFSTFNYYRLIKKEFVAKDVDYSILSDVDLYNKIVYIFTTVPGTVELEKQLSGIKAKHNLTDEFIECLQNGFLSLKKKSPSPLKYHALSEKALIKSVEYMQKESKNFMQIKGEYNLDSEKKKEIISKYEKLNRGEAYINPIFIDDIIASPQVKKSLRQSLRVINEIIKTTGNLPEVIAIESTSEMNSDEKKKEIKKYQKIQEDLRKEAVKNLEANGNEISENNIRKMICYIEMNGHCAYTNKKISFNEAEIEHILPISKSFDNSLDNITISTKNTNYAKDNMTPYQYLSPLNQFESFKKRIIDNKKISPKKKENFIFNDDLNKYEKRFFNKNLRDTAYATKELVNQINNFNEYLKSIDKTKKIKTLSTPGQLTSRIRDQNKIIKDRDAGKFHHAVDASIVVALTNTDVGKKIIYAQNNDQFWVKFKEKTKKLDEDIKNINIYKNKEEINKIDNDDKIRISSQVNKDPQKLLSNANIVKIIKKEDNHLMIKQINNIYELTKFDQLEKMLDEDNQTKKLLIQDNNPKLFKKLKEIFNKYYDKNKPENPFVLYLKEKHGIEEGETIDYEKIGIRSSEKETSPIVKKLRYMEKINDPYLLEKETIKKHEKTLIGLEGLSQVCTKVYKDVDNKKFVFLPIYSISVDLKTGKVKPNDKYYEMYYNKYIGDKNVEHIVYLYNGDFIKITKRNKKNIETIISNFDKTNNVIACKDGTYFTTSDRELTVYDVDVLGNKKTRLTVNLD